MAVEQFTMKPEPERLEFSTNQHETCPSSHLHRSLRGLRQDRRQDSLIEAKDSAGKREKVK